MDIENNDLACRNKYWKELTSDEKIERTREQINLVKDRIERLENKQYNTDKLLRDHAHLDNKVVSIIKDSSYCHDEEPSSRRNRYIGNPDEVYF